MKFEDENTCQVAREALEKSSQGKKVHMSYSVNSHKKALSYYKKVTGRYIYINML